jgi:hypothetical protein
VPDEEEVEVSRSSKRELERGRRAQSAVIG